MPLSAPLSAPWAGEWPGAGPEGVGLGAGAAIRAARLRDAGRALERGDVRGAVGLLLAAVAEG